MGGGVIGVCVMLCYRVPGMVSFLVAFLSVCFCITVCTHNKGLTCGCCVPVYTVFKHLSIYL